MKIKMRSVQLFFVLGFFCFGLNAYEFSTGKFFLRGVAGPGVNVVRFDEDPAQNTPGAGLVLGVEGEYVIDKPWSLIGGVRPSFSPGYVDIGFGAGAKYRWSDLGIPLHIYVAMELTPAVLVPTSTGTAHFNVGLRPSFGVDYFLMRDLVLGTQVAFEPSLLWNAPIRRVEATVEFVFGLMYKI